MSEPNSALEDARARVAHLERLNELEQELAASADAYEGNPTEEAYAAHNRASEALVEHRAQRRSESGPVVGGDAFVVPEGSNQQAEGEE
jgi:hypothetical protein